MREMRNRSIPTWDEIAQWSYHQEDDVEVGWYFLFEHEIEGLRSRWLGVKLTYQDKPLNFALVVSEQEGETDSHIKAIRDFFALPLTEQKTSLSNKQLQKLLHYVARIRPNTFRNTSSMRYPGYF